MQVARHTKARAVRRQQEMQRRKQEMIARRRRAAILRDRLLRMFTISDADVEKEVGEFFRQEGAADYFVTAVNALAAAVLRHNQRFNQE